MFHPPFVQPITTELSAGVFVVPGLTAAVIHGAPVAAHAPTDDADVDGDPGKGPPRVNCVSLKPRSTVVPTLIALPCGPVTPTAVDPEHADQSAATPPAKDDAP